MRIVVGKRYEFICATTWSKSACESAFYRLFGSLKWRTDKNADGSLVGSRFGKVGRILIEIFTYRPCDQVLVRFEAPDDAHLIIKMKVIVRKRSPFWPPFIPVDIKEQGFPGYLVHSLDNQMLFENVIRSWVEVFRPANKRIFGDDWLTNWSEPVPCRHFQPAVMSDRMAEWVLKLGIP